MPCPDSAWHRLWGAHALALHSLFGCLRTPLKIERGDMFACHDPRLEEATQYCVVSVLEDDA